MRKYFINCLLFCLCVAFSAATPAGDNRRLVLAARIDSNITTLSAPEVRRLFLGVPIFANGSPVQPLRNASDPLIEEVFLQKVLFMSRESYERLLLTKVMRTGGMRSLAYTTDAQLMQAIENNRNAVTYVWAGDLGGKPLRIIAELWRE